MTTEEKSALDALTLELKSSIDAKLNDAKTNSSAEILELKSKLTELEAKSKDVKPADYDTLKEEHIALMAEFKSFKEVGKSTPKVSLGEEIKSNKDLLKSIAKKDSAKELELKALTNRASIATNPSVQLDLNITSIATRKLTAYDLFTKIPLSVGQHNGTYSYIDWDEATVARAAAAVAEGATFPQSTATFKGYSVTLKKIGDTLPVTEEFFEDESLAAAELEMFLDTNVALEIDRQLILADGTGNTITGINSIVPAFTAVASGITDASIYDLIVKVSESITKTGGAKYSPDFVLMNITDINKMKLKKDVNHNYIMPPFVDRSGAVVNGITIVECNILTGNTMIVGDKRYGKIIEMGGVVISKGEVGTNFTDDIMTLKARKRLAFLIKKADQNGFAKVASISASLVTLAS